MRAVLSLLIGILLLGVYPVSAQQTCPAPLLEGGLQAWVSSTEPQSLYESYSTTSPVLTLLQPGRIVFILNESACAEGSNWWMVTVRNGNDLLVGWIHEGTAGYTLLRGRLLDTGLVSLTLPQGIASNANARSVPPTRGASQPWLNRPPYLRLLLEDYQKHATVSDRLPELRFFRVADFANYDTAFGLRGRNVAAALQTQIAERPSWSPDPTAFADDVLIGEIETTTHYHLQPRYLDFQNGAGYRLLVFIPTGFHQGLPTLEYRYMGLTSDGAFLVVGVFPLGTPVLASQFAASAPIADPLEAYVDYVTNIVEYLGQSTDNAFTPSLHDLDLLIASILINPSLWNGDN